MKYRLGTSIIVHDNGQTNELECPNCKNKVQFSVFSNLDIRLKPKLPLIGSNAVYFLVCPKCAAIYTVDTARGKAFSDGEKLSIGNFDFKELKKFD